jgi:hypothetical protein
MAIHSKHLETLEAIIATALNIVKNRPLADLYIRRDYTGEFRIRVQPDSGLRAQTADRIATLRLASDLPRVLRLSWRAVRNHRRS